MHPFVIVLIIAVIINGINIGYMIRSRRLHNLCIKKRKQNKNK
jgi:hypothetical protein